jgi:gluconolactonase
MPEYFVSPFVEVANGLRYPEGPVWLSDGSFVVVEVTGGNVVRFAPDAASPTGFSLAQSIPVGGGPNGAAIGPGGALYVVNNGGIDSIHVPGLPYSLEVPTYQPANYTGGSIQRVTLETGAVETWCATDSAAGPVPPCGGMPPLPKGTLRGPDDLVFDSEGGLWFTDWGKAQLRSRDVTGVWYLPPGSRNPIEKIPSRAAPNGIALSPAGDRLYVAETYSRWIVFWDLSGPGQIKCNPLWADGANLLTAALPGMGQLDSMALDEQGNLYVVTLMTAGPTPAKAGGITVVSPAGRILEYIELDIGAPDPLPSNICFGGPDRRTAFITLGGTGRVVTCRTRIPGLKHAFEK